MKDVQVYDDQRQPIWRDSLGPSDVAAFYVDGRRGRYVTDRGLRFPSYWKRTCTIFPSLADAVAHAERHVIANPGVAVRLYDSVSSDEPTQVVANDAELAGMTPARARWLSAWGTLLIVIGVAMFVLDWLNNWLLILGAVVGSKFLTVGFVRLGEGLNSLWERRKGRDKLPRQAVSSTRGRG